MTASNDSDPTRRMICQWAVLGVGSGFVAGCRANDSTDGVPTPVASVITHTRRRRVFFKEFVAKRFGHPPRESKQVFELPLRSQPPFALLLDYAVDEHGAVIVDVNGKEVVDARSFPASGHYDDSRRIEIPLTLSRFEINDILTRVVAVGWGFAKIQVVGHWKAY
jgi:hypothetical protein